MGFSSTILEPGIPRRMAHRPLALLRNQRLGQRSLGGSPLIPPHGKSFEGVKKVFWRPCPRGGGVVSNLCRVTPHRIVHALIQQESFNMKRSLFAEGEPRFQASVLCSSRPCCVLPCRDMQLCEARSQMGVGGLHPKGCIEPFTRRRAFF